VGAGVAVLAVLWLAFQAASALAAGPGPTIAIGEVTAPVDLNNPQNVTARIKRLAQDSGHGALEKFVHGTVKVTPGAGDSPDVSIEWFGLSSDAQGGDAVALAPPLTTQHKVTDVKIESGVDVSIAGDVNALVRASRTIAENAEQAPVEEETEGETVASSRPGGSAAQAGSGASTDTTEAKLPEITAVTDTETVETIVNTDAFGTTAEGCTPELSEDGATVVIMEAPTKNGKKDGDCAPALDRPEVKSTYIGCGYEIRLDEQKAYAKKRRYYVYGGKSTDLDTDCAPDLDKGYAITETEKGCKIVPDLTTKLAKQFTALLFTGRENEAVQVEGCAPREGQTYPITQKLCEPIDDFAAKRTNERKIATYVAEDGLARNIGDCTETGNFFVHNFDTSVCSPLADYSSNKLFAQYRVRIDTPTGPEFRTPSCKPFSDALTDLLETQAGCESFHRDYAGYSLGGKRIIRKDNNQEMRECREADVRYEHYYEAEGWLRKDATLEALPKQAAYIDLPQPAGKTLISQAVVRAGVAPVAYTANGFSYQEGEPEYVPDSCDKYIKQKKMERWIRPDGTTHTVQNGFGPSLGPSPDCKATVSTTWNKVSERMSGYSANASGTFYHSSATYSGTRTLTRADGVEISVTTGQGSWPNCKVRPQPCTSACLPGQSTNICPSTVSDTALITSWRAGLLW